MQFRSKKTVFLHQHPDREEWPVLPLMMAHRTMVQGVRSEEHLEHDKIAIIKAQGFDPEKAVALIGRWNRRKILILDGNHRLHAALETGVEWIPIILLDDVMMRRFSIAGADMIFRVEKVGNPVRWDQTHKPRNPI